MKINPLGIQSYQSPNSAKSQIEQKPATGAGDQTVVVTPQPESAKSAIAVKATPTDYGALLTDSERKAMEALFARFKEGGRAGQAATAESERGLGQFVDIKV